ncbi:MAG: DNA mismatch repair protein MutS, partial [Bdellovibrionaceae bacterium]|nr:DNA mismatch repair protein MutS [Pseudobdellovibrionaceae bacterium]
MPKKAFPPTPHLMSIHTSELLGRKIKKLRRLVQEWTKRLQNYQSARLIAALLFFVSMVPAAMKTDARTELAYPAPFLIAFLFLVWRTRQLSRHARNLSRLELFLNRQLQRSLGLPSGRSWQQAQQRSLDFPLIKDLGLVGSHSLWTLLDETLSEGGQKNLLRWMSVEPLDPAVITARQQQIQKLRPQTWFYSRLGIQADSNEFNLSTLQIQDFLKNSFVQKSFPLLFAANVIIWLLTVGLALYATATATPIPPYVYLLFPILSLSSLGATGGAFLSGVGLSHHLSALAPTFAAIERRSKVSSELRKMCARIFRDSPSKSAKKLDFILGFVGTQTNPILHLFLNVFSPWTIVSVFFLERLRSKMIQDFPACIEELSEFEVVGSMLIFDKYQTRTYPQVVSETVLQTEQIFHPLIDRARAVANDFAFPRGQSLGLLTGSNMSGKSTFLRTIGINQVLANMGAPVFANSLTTRPLKIETCIEVTDSLRDGYSYFYAEVRKLKDILQTAATKTPVLFL